MLGPDEYLFGEEKALLEVIEGHDPLPRLLPPYEHGLFATDIQTGWQSVDEPATRGAQGQPNPTLVNNVETLAHVPRILRDGAGLVPLDGHGRVARHHGRHGRRRRRRALRRARSSWARRCGT